MRKIFPAIILAITISVGTACVSTAEEAADARAAALQATAVARLRALADSVEAEAKKTSKEFEILVDAKLFSESTSAGNDSMRVLRNAMAGLENSQSVVTRDVMQTPDARILATEITTNLAGGGASADWKDFVGIKMRGKLYGLASEKVGAFKTHAGYLRQLAKSIESGPAKETVAKLEVASLAPEVSKVMGSVTQSLALYSTASPRVVGRAKSSIDYPAVAAIMMDDGRGIFDTRCTGTLIASNIVLSAAHCFCDYSARQKFRTAATCRAGKFRLVGNRNVGALSTDYRQVFFQHAGVRKIKKIEIADDYAFPVGDLAVVVLAEPIDDIEPITINRARNSLSGQVGTIIGFGRHSRLDSSGQPTGGGAFGHSSGLKFSARTKIGTCTGNYAGKRLICWEYSDRPTLDIPNPGSTCQGDSGGPLVVKMSGANTLVGVTSAGLSSICRPGDSAIDVDLSQFSSWIDDKIRQHAIPTPRSKPFDQLDPYENVYHDLYVLWRDYIVFDLSSPKWRTKIKVTKDSRAMLVGLNSHSFNSTKALRIKIWEPGQALTDRPVCDVQTEGNALNCPVLEHPVRGVWQFEAEGPAGIAFQAVATAYKASP